MIRWLPGASLAFACLAALAPLAHVLELPNKLALDGPLWLAVQQHLYRGWGPFLGAPSEIGALVTSALLAAFGAGPRGPALIASACDAGMVTAFFVLNAPVNQATSAWTVATLPADWSAYRARWEAGHALAALLACVALGALLARGRAGAATSSTRTR